MARLVGAGFVTPDEVRARMTALDGDWSTLAADASRCPGGDPRVLAGFQTDLDAWKAFFLANKDVFWSAGSIMTALDGWQSRLADWQPKIAGLGCAISGAPVTKPTTPTLELGTPAIFGAGVAAALLIIVLLRR